MKASWGRKEQYGSIRLSINKTQENENEYQKQMNMETLKQTIVRKEKVAKLVEKM
jgi:hypothetical protein